MAVHNLRSNGNPAQDLDFDQPVVNIGSHPENDIAIAGPGVLAFHALVVVQEGVYQLVPLAAEAEISVDGHPVQGAGIGLAENQPVQIGGYTLSFRRNGTPTSLHVSLLRPESAGKVPLAVSTNGDSAILVNVLARQAEIQVEQSALYEMEVVNAGPIVAGFSVSLHGVPEEWVEITPRTFNLYEDQRTVVSIKVTPPREPESAAGKHPLSAVVSSSNYAGSQVSVPLDLVIQPYYQFALGNLSPKQQNISWRKRVGLTKLPITNQGNGATDFSISALDEENGCSFDFQVRDDLQLNRQATFNLPAGATVNLPIEITPLKRSVFALRSRRYQYTTTVQVAQQTTSPQIVSGSVTSYPLFGWWSIVLGILAILLALFILLQPRITDFIVVAGKDVIELGDTTKLEWSVSPFATRLNLSGVDQAIAYGQTSLTVAPKQSTTYELVAGNWLSGLLGLDQKRIQTVLVVPPAPQVNVFEVDSTSVARGKAVNLRWSVTQADSAILTIGGVVYALTPDKFSGEQSVVLDKDSLVTLEARNASGSELRSYLINVVEPSVTVKAFTVWVRPQKASLGASSQPPVALVPNTLPVSLLVPHLAALAQGQTSAGLGGPAAADDFTQKFVELIPDKSSDSGYRVEFYQPDRELSKGEQVMIEWNVEGTDADTVQIAPFTEVLPSRGRQPFFPTASMNFVMTAQSGNQKKLFMLPVVVFDGVPPAAPKIDIYKASPMGMIGAGKVQFAWSVSGDWTRIQLANGKGVVADYLNPQGFKTVGVNKSETFILTAWNGKLSTSSALDITVSPALIDPGLVVSSIAPTTGRSQVGGKLTVTVGFSSVPSGGTYPTGSVTVTDGSAICSITLPAVSCSLVFTTSGVKTISASFPGDKIYQQSKSPDFSQQVIVASAQVDLTPVFYFNGGIAPISVESSTFDMDKGLHTIVEVRPRNTVLADNNGNISVSICDQDGTGAVIQSTCSFVGAAQVKVAATTGSGQTAGYGYADVVISNFNASGVRGLLFEYTHSSNAIDPTSIFQPNIHINRTKLILSLSTCADSMALTSCTYGLVTGSTPEVIFDLNTPGPTVPILLSSLLPAPQTGAFTLSSSPAATWGCVTKVASGTYKLDCKVTGAGLVSGTLYTVSYAYANANPLPGSGVRNDYYMGSDPTIPFGAVSFPLKVLSSTKVLIGSLSGIKVGERIHLTGPSDGLVSILDGANTRLFPSTGLTLTEKSGADIFGVEKEGINCARDGGDGSKIIVTAANADCYIYFKHTGNYTLVATFAGDSNNNGSTSGDTQVTVQKQVQISAAVQYLDPASGSYGSTFPAALTTNKSSSMRVVLTGPASNFSPPDTSFPPTALADRKVLVTLNAWGTTNCALNTDPGSLVTDLTGGVYEVTITQKTIGDPTLQLFVTAADFNVICTQPDSLGLSFTLTFSDKTTPKKDSDDFGFATSPVGKFNLPVSLPSLGSMTVSVNRQDAGNTNMLSGTTIGKLHFGQRYSVGIASSSNISVPYQYYVDYTYTYICPLGTSCTLASPPTASANPASVSSATRSTVLSNYALNAKWSLDPSNFLSLGTNLGTTGSTCGTDMNLTTTNLTPGSPPEFTQWAFLSFNWQWSGLSLVYTYQYRATSYGTMTLQLSTPPAQKCTLVFDGTGSVNTPVTATTGTIGVNARSGDGLFVVNSVFNVSGIDKQAVSLAFTPAGALSGYINTALPVTLNLASTDLTGGTALPFVDTGAAFSAQFSPTLDAACASLSQVGSVTPTLTETFISTSLYPACNNQLSYLGNKYYQSLLNQSLPALSVAQHGSSSAFAAALPFAGSAFTNTTYSNLSVHVADAEGHSSPIPDGTVKVEVFNSANTAYDCTDYILTISPAVACLSGAYLLPLDASGNTAAFSVSFAPTMVSTGNYFKLTYAGSSNFLGSTSSSTAFQVKKHTSSVAFTAAPPFLASGVTKGGVYSALTVRVSDADGLGHATPIPAGTVKIEVFNSANVAYTCAAGAANKYLLTGPAVACAADSYTLTLDGTGNTPAFILTFDATIPTSSGNYIKLTYVSSNNSFSGTNSSTAPFAVNP
jgi:hypothetical protein